MFIHNISETEKTYMGQPIAADGFFFIAETKRLSYSENESLLTDVMIGDAAISIDGESDLEDKAAMIKTLLGNQITTKAAMVEGGLRKSDRGFTFTALAGATTSADYAIDEDLQIKGGVLYTTDSHIFDSVDMEIVDVDYLHAGDWYPATPTLAGIAGVTGLAWAQVAPTGVGLHHYLKGFPVSLDGTSKIKNAAITNTPLNGLVIRISYKSNGITDVKCNVGIVAYS